MNILITGARAPSCLEVGRQLKKYGNNVHISDSAALTLTRFSNQFDGYLKFSSPRFEFEIFEKQLYEYTSKHNIDLVIPTCEEVFYLSKIKKDLKSDLFFCDEFEKIQLLHSKFEFSKLSKKWTLQTPDTFRVENYEDWLKLNLQKEDFVFKPVFSRFAAHTLINPTEAALKRNLSAGFSWVAQRKVLGTEICLYAICVHGRLTAFTAYKPIYRAGLGAGVYLEPFYDEALVQFVQSFAANQNFHGQVAFDIIQNASTGKFELLECNPRATSGVHFFGPEISNAFTKGNADILFGDCSRPRMVAAAVLIYGAPWKSFNLALWKKFYSDYNKASDVVWDWNDLGPYLGQYFSFGIFIIQSLLLGESAIAVSSRDIEYNG